MPGWQVHDFMDRSLFGRSYGKVHRKMDEPCFYLGRKHRVLFHDYTSVRIIAQGCYPNDDNAVWAAWNHITVDEVCTADPAYKKFLEELALLDKVDRQQERRNKEKVKLLPIEKRLRKDLKQMKKLREIQDYLRYG